MARDLAEPERLVIRTLGGLITIGVPLKGELSKDIENAAAAANKIVARAKNTYSRPGQTFECRVGAEAAMLATLDACQVHSTSRRLRLKT
jgi:hypothetical protein